MYLGLGDGLHYCATHFRRNMEHAQGPSRVGPTADYTWSVEIGCGAPNAARTAEQWLRKIWEGAPSALRHFLRFAWRFGLGLRLDPPGSPNHVLGWPIAQNQSDCITVAADSRIMSARNEIWVSDGTIRWTTAVTFNNVVGRILWAPARQIHQRIVPWSIRRAVNAQT
jgi:hypothetical protein